MNDNSRIYSCYCLFDICAISKNNRESFQEIGVRVSNYMRKLYDQLLKNGFCSCSHCKRQKFRVRGV